MQKEMGLLISFIVLRCRQCCCQRYFQIAVILGVYKAFYDFFCIDTAHFQIKRNGFLRRYCGDKKLLSANLSGIITCFLKKLLSDSLPFEMIIHKKHRHIGILRSITIYTAIYTAKACELRIAKSTNGSATALKLLR